MAIKEIPTFPYMSEDLTIAPYRSGTLDDGHNIIATYLPLCGATQTAQSERKLSGTIVEGYCGNTNMIFADRVQYGQQAGDS
jgi:hypothetical protein